MPSPTHTRSPAWPVKKPNGHWQIMANDQWKSQVDIERSWPMRVEKPDGHWQILADEQQLSASTNCLSFSRSNQFQHQPNASVLIPSTF